MVPPKCSDYVCCWYSGCPSLQNPYSKEVLGVWSRRAQKSLLVSDPDSLVHCSVIFSVRPCHSPGSSNTIELTCLLSSYDCHLLRLKGNLSQRFALSPSVFPLKNLTSPVENTHQDGGLFESTSACPATHPFLGERGARPGDLLRMPEETSTGPCPDLLGLL